RREGSVDDGGRERNVGWQIPSDHSGIEVGVPEQKKIASAKLKHVISQSRLPLTQLRFSESNSDNNLHPSSTFALRVPRRRERPTKKPLPRSPRSRRTSGRKKRIRQSMFRHPSFVSVFSRCKHGQSM